MLIPLTKTQYIATLIREVFSDVCCLNLKTPFTGTVKSVLSDHSKRRPMICFQDRLLLNAGQKYCRMHLMGYLNKHKLIHECQSGFRQKHRCNTALVKLIDKWMASIDKGDIIGTLFIDFRKAFDMVDHSLLMKKVAHYRLSIASLNWFRSYLSTRVQSIKSDDGFSDFLELLSGVPQGSILGPTLFLLFINDLPLHLNHCLADLYADDNTIHASGKINRRLNTNCSLTQMKQRFGV